MNPHDEQGNERQIASLLGASETGAVSPDRDALARLRGQSTEVFAAASTQHTTRKLPLFLRGARWLGAAAAVFVFGLGLYSWLAPGTSGVALGQVLENVEKAQTLHARFSRGNQQLEFWHTSQPRRSRWDDLEG